MSNSSESNEARENADAADSPNLPQHRHEHTGEPTYLFEDLSDGCSSILIQYKSVTYTLRRTKNQKLVLLK